MDRAQAQQRMNQAKAQMTRAAEAALSLNPHATAIAAQALEEMRAARAELELLDQSDQTFGTQRSIARATR